MLPLLILQVALAQAPADTRAPVAVVLTSRRPGADAVAAKISQRVLESFKREGVTAMDDATATKELRAAGFSDPRSCQGTRACLSKLAILLGPKAVVVGVDVGKVGKTLAIHLEAVAADKDASLGALDVSSSLNGWSDAMSAPIVVFVRDVKAGLELKKSVKEPPPSTPPLETAGSDAPTKTELTPQVKVDDQPTIVSNEPGKPPRVAAWAFAGGAAAAAGVAIGFGISAGSAKQQFDASLVTLEDGSRGTTLTETQARQLADQANSGTVVAIASGVISAGLTAAATYFFLKD